MTPERLNEIRERLDLYGGLDPLDVSDLIGVVDRLLNPTEGETDE